jgi:hypothetical protein
MQVHSWRYLTMRVTSGAGFTHPPLPRYSYITFKICPQHTDFIPVFPSVETIEGLAPGDWKLKVLGFSDKHGCIVRMKAGVPKDDRRPFLLSLGEETALTLRPGSRLFERQI